MDKGVALLALSTNGASEEFCEFSDGPPVPRLAGLAEAPVASLLLSLGEVLEVKRAAKAAEIEQIEQALDVWLSVAVEAASCHAVEPLPGAMVVQLARVHSCTPPACVPSECRTRLCAMLTKTSRAVPRRGDDRGDIQNCIRHHQVLDRSTERHLVNSGSPDAAPSLSRGSGLPEAR